MTKIKDLTDLEAKRICERCNHVCEICPLNIPNFPICMADLKNLNPKMFNKLLNEEIATYY